jgi:hypothetical protein
LTAGAALAKIISIGDKINDIRDKRASSDRKRKILAVRKVLQCSSCALKCEKCGVQIEPDVDALEQRRRNLQVPYNFCEPCSEDYLDYIDRLKGKGDSACYWHNDAWMDAWRNWIDYQSSIDRYVKSKEFKLLLQELKQAGPDE